MFDKQLIMKRVIATSIVAVLLMISLRSISLATPPSEAAGAHTTSGSSQPSYKWYFSEGYTGFDNWIAIRNTSTSTANVTFVFYNTGYKIATANLSVPANRRGTLHVNDVITYTTNYCCYISSDRTINAQQSLYSGNEGASGDGTWGLCDSTWTFGDIFSESGATSYIQIQNAASYDKYYSLWLGYQGTPQTSTKYIKAFSRGSWTISSSSAENKVGVVYPTTSAAPFSASRSWKAGTKLTSCGGSSWPNANNYYFAEGYSSYWTWIVSGFTTRSNLYGVALLTCDRWYWGNTQNSSFSFALSNNSSYSKVSVVPSGYNYSTRADLEGIYTPPPGTSPGVWYWSTERTTQYNDWATSSEGRCDLDYPDETWFFADCYTGHTVYLTFANPSPSAYADFHVWVTTETSNNYSFDISIQESGSICLNDLIPGAQNCSIYVEEIYHRWPVSVEKSEYFN